MDDCIVVLDSGVGGLDILNHLMKNLANEHFYYIADNKNVPYGQKTKEEIQSFGIALALKAKSLNAKMIVIACNTLSLNAIDKMRECVDIPIYGIARPTIKGFLNHNLKSVLVLGTPATINSYRYVDFLYELAPNVKVYQQAAPKLVVLIENNDFTSIDNAIKEYVDTYADKIDAIILGCTHYPIALSNFKRLYPNLVIIDSRKQMVQLVNDKLDFHKIRANCNNKGITSISATGSIEQLVNASKHFFDYNMVNIVKGKE